jgi:hypothetical protein
MSDNNNADQDTKVAAYFKSSLQYHLALKTGDLKMLVRPEI